jgi:Uncharacterized Zn-finger containing protein
MNSLGPKKVNVIFWITLLIGFIISFGGILSNIKTLMVIGFIVIITGVIFRFIFYRCPHCGKYLDRSTGEYCPYCGEKVNK